MSEGESERNAMSDASHHGKERRAHPRVQGACELLFQNESHPLTDWSAGGCAVPQVLPGAKVGAELPIDLIVTGPNTRMFMKLTGRVVRVDQEATALQFTGLTNAERDLLLIAQGAFSKNLYLLDPDEEEAGI
jgi:hypothetical protein